MVEQARGLAVDLGFPDSSGEEVGRLLQMLVAHHPTGRIGEIGTGCGVGAAWIASGLAPTARFITVERDPARARAATALFEPLPNVTVIAGDWLELLGSAPFDLLFVDVRPAKEEASETVVDALAIGGMAVLDDFTPEHAWTPAQRRQWTHGDPVRARWLGHPQLVAQEIQLTATSAVLIAVRRAPPVIAPTR